MTDQVPTVDGNGASGNQPGVSSQPIEGEAERLTKLFEARLSEALKPVLAEVRGVQSRQDKDRKGFQEVLDEFKKLKAKGLSDEEAESAMLEGRKASEKDTLLYKMAEKLGVLNESANKPAGNGGSGSDADAAVITALQLDSNDAGVLKIVHETPDVVQRTKRLADYKASLGNRAPEAANAPTLQSAPAVSATVDKEAVAREIGKLSADPKRNRAKIEELSAQLKGAK